MNTQTIPAGELRDGDWIVLELGEGGATVAVEVIVILGPYDKGQFMDAYLATNPAVRCTVTTDHTITIARRDGG